jgi:hypothetical protein
VPLSWLLHRRSTRCHPLSSLHTRHRLLLHDPRGLRSPRLTTAHLQPLSISALPPPILRRPLPHSPPPPPPAPAPGLTTQIPSAAAVATRHAPPRRPLHRSPAAQAWCQPMENLCSIR